MYLLRWICRLRTFRRAFLVACVIVIIVISLLHLMSHTARMNSKLLTEKIKKQTLWSNITKIFSNTSTISPPIVGSVNIDIWTKTCSVNLNSIRQFPLFPLFPSERRYFNVTGSLKYDIIEMFSAMRIMGYFHPPTTGMYKFHLKSPVMSQLWVSTTNSPKDTSKLAYISKNLVNQKTISISEDNPVSDGVILQLEKTYYFEILLAVNDALPQPGALTLFWMLPGTSFFTKITGSHVTKYFNTASYYTTPDSPVLNATLPSLQFSDKEDEFVGKHYSLDKERTEESKLPEFSLTRPQVKEVLGAHLDSDNYKDMNKTVKINMSYMDMHNNSIVESFSKCTYNPAYTKRRKIKRYDGVWQTFFPFVFPNDGTNLVRFSKPFKGYIDHIRGNPFLNEKNAIEVVKNFMDQVNKKPPRRYSLVKIVNVELYNPKPINGEKYLLELILKSRHDKKIYKFSGFFFRNQDHKDLCFLQNMQWNPKVWIHVILNIKNQPGWVLSFVQEMARILQESRDKYVNFIVADYGNKGVDISKEMERHGIESFQVFKRSGPFHKTSTINMAASKVTDPNSIVLLMDLHLQFPTNLFDVIRKHTIQGRTGFSPMLMRLFQCGRPKTKHMYPHGFFEPNGFGIFGIYKSDWDRFGGMNEKEFKNKWGGEDWEMVDRVLMHGYEIEKLRIPGFYHFDHDKVGMWNKR